MSRLLALVLVASAGAAGLVAEELEVNRVRLRQVASVDAGPVTLGDVLTFSETDPALAERVSSITIMDELHAGGVGVVTHAQVAQRLDHLGVNMSRVLLGGAARCRVSRPAPAAVEHEGEEADLFAESRVPSPDSERTLAYLLQAHVDNELADLGGTAEIRFERAGQEYLQLTTPPWEFRISSVGRERLGLREFRVLIRRDGKAQRKAEVYAHVRMVRQAVVAARPLSLGNTVRREDVTLETRVFGPGDDIGLASIDEAIGQQVRRFVAAGELVPSGALKSVDLVRRSRPVTLLGGSANVELRTTGVAMDSGMLGDTVRVRVGQSRDDRKVLRGVVVSLGTVRLLEGRS
jgi:flagella basal body P-ring formation protein FlgA